MTFGMAAHLAAQMIDQHLRAEADAEQRLVLGQRHGEPVGLQADVVMVVISAHRPAEHDGAAVPAERVGKRIAERRPADVERKTARLQHLADPSGRRGLLMQNDENRLQPGGSRHDRLSSIRRRRRCHRRRIALPSPPAAAKPGRVRRSTGAPPPARRYCLPVRGLRHRHIPFPRAIL